MIAVFPLPIDVCERLAGPVHAASEQLRLAGDPRWHDVQLLAINMAGAVAELRPSVADACVPDFESVTVAEWSRSHDMPQRTVRRHCAQGLLPARKIRGRWQIAAWTTK